MFIVAHIASSESVAVAHWSFAIFVAHIAIDSNDLARVASINFSRLDFSSSLQNISKNVFGLSLGALEIVLLIFLDILSRS